MCLLDVVVFGFTFFFKVHDYFQNKGLFYSVILKLMLLLQGLRGPFRRCLWNSRVIYQWAQYLLWRRNSGFSVNLPLFSQTAGLLELKLETFEIIKKLGFLDGVYVSSNTWMARLFPCWLSCTAVSTHSSTHQHSGMFLRGTSTLRWLKALAAGTQRSFSSLVLFTQKYNMWWFNSRLDCRDRAKNQYNNTSMLQTHSLLGPLTPFLGICPANILAHRRNDGYTRSLFATLFIRRNDCQPTKWCSQRGMG